MLTVGENFLRYKVLSLIGGGGMGDVYLAKDQQLERKVAIKVLRKKFSRQNKDALERFILEARSASALNHPNIITIYEIGESEGSRYIASEYIEGTTLHDKLDSNSLALSEILNIAVQIAEALTAAHTAGIVHRDVKPENVMIREDGYVKVLDFGLAKLTENGRRSVDVEAETKKMVATDPGIILGTVSYMSPEQARGRNIDARSDIWSLGVVIYEMLTGRRPFVGDTTSDVIAAILKSNPAEISVHAPEAPKALERIVNKALRKDREERYQHIKDLLIDLKDLRRELDAKLHTDSGRLHATDEGSLPGSTGDAATPALATDPLRLTTRSIRESLVTQFRLHPLAAIIIIVVIAAAFIAGGVWTKNLIQRTGGASAFQSMRFTRLTSSGNAEGGIAAISKDGRYVAYVVNDGGKQALFVRQTISDGTAQIVPPSNTSYSGAVFSNDGNYVYFTGSLNNEHSSVYSVATLGGTPRKIIENAYGPVSVSADGSQITFVRDGREIIIAGADGSNSRTLSSATGSDAYNFPLWSSDGNSILTAAYSAADSRFHLISISILDGAKVDTTGRSWLSINGISLVPDGILLSARDSDTLYSQIWIVTLSSGGVSRITNDLANYTGLSVQDDGKTLVTIQENKLINIWAAEESAPANSRKITAEIGREEGLSGISWTPAGKILYTARVPATEDIWLVDPSDGTNRQLTFNVGSNFHQVASPDGRYVIFVSDRGGNVNLWRMGIDGQNPVQLTDTPGIEGQPTFTPDGRWALYHYLDENRQVSIWKVPLNGGEPTRLTGLGASRPIVSPDGKIFACKYYMSDGTKKIGLFPIDGGQPLKLLDLPEVAESHMFRWANDSKSFIYVDTKSGFDLYSQPIDGGPARMFIPSGPDRIYTFDISRNGKNIAFSRGTETSDAVMIRNFK